MLAGQEPPKWADDESSLDELRARIRKTIELAKSAERGRIEGSEAREIEMQAGPDRTFELSGEDLLTKLSLPNFYFHATTTYALLRQAGVELGKRDFLGAF